MRLTEPAKMQIKMLGEFSMTYGDNIRLEDTGHSRKVWNLLCYLIANRVHEVSREELKAILWTEKLCDDAGNALKNLIYRLRLMMTAAKLPNQTYILLQRGKYIWNNAVPCVVDVDVFEEKWQKARQSPQDSDASLMAYLEAIALYDGQFLPKLANEPWVRPLVAHYQQIYLDCVRGAFEGLSDKGEYEQAVEICHQAVAVEPNHEAIYELMMSGLVKLGRYNDAINVYHKMSNHLSKTLGVAPSEQIRRCYGEIVSGINGVEMDLAVIKEDLRQAAAKEGVHYCTYEIFKNVYRFVTRGVVRGGGDVHILLFTLTAAEQEAVLDVKRHSRLMAKLHDAIAESLRREDVFAQYSNTQYVVMLPGTNFQDGERIAERVHLNYKRRYHRKDVVLRYKLQTLEISNEGSRTFSRH